MSAKQLTRSALAAKKSRGERVGSVPVGKRLDDDGKSLVVDDHEVACIALARQWSTEGLSLRTISDSLAERGLVGRRGKRLSPTTVARICLEPQTNNSANATADSTRTTDNRRGDDRD